MTSNTVLQKRLSAATAITLLLILLSYCGSGGPSPQSGVLPPDLEPVVELIAPSEVLARPLAEGLGLGLGQGQAQGQGQGSLGFQQDSGLGGVGAYISSREEQRGPASDPRPGVVAGNAAPVVEPTSPESEAEWGVNSNGTAPALAGSLLAFALDDPDAERSASTLNQVDTWLRSWTPPAALTGRPVPSGSPGTVPTLSADEQPPEAQLQSLRPPLLGGPTLGGPTLGEPTLGGFGPGMELPEEEGKPQADPTWPNERDARAIPEPPPLTLLLIGLLGLLGLLGLGWIQGRRSQATRV